MAKVIEETGLHVGDGQDEGARTVFCCPWRTRRHADEVDLNTYNDLKSLEESLEKLGSNI